MYKKYKVITSLFALVTLCVPTVVQATLTVGATSLTSDAALTINAVANTADAIYLHANGGVSETIKLHADQGTGIASINLLSDAGGVTLQAATALAINVTSATAASNITVAVDADAEDFTISTTGSAGDIFITSADDLTLTGSPVALVSTGNITVNTNVVFTNGVVVYNDTGDGDGDCSAGTYSMNLSQGNFFGLYGDNNGNCTLSFSNGVVGGIYYIQLQWAGAFDFILAQNGGLTRTIKQICEGTGATPDDDGDVAHLVVRAFTSNTVGIISCVVNQTDD